MAIPFCGIDIEIGETDCLSLKLILKSNLDGKKLILPSVFRPLFKRNTAYIDALKLSICPTAAFRNSIYILHLSAASYLQLFLIRRFDE